MSLPNCIYYGIIPDALKSDVNRTTIVLNPVVSKVNTELMTLSQFIYLIKLVFQQQTQLMHRVLLELQFIVHVHVYNRYNNKQSNN